MRGRRGGERERTYPEGWDGEGDFCGGAGGGAMSGSSKADDRRRDCDRAFDPRRKKTTPYSLLSQGEIERTDEAYVIVANVVNLCYLYRKNYSIDDWAERWSPCVAVTFMQVDSGGQKKMVGL